MDRRNLLKSFALTAAGAGLLAGVGMEGSAPTGSKPTAKKTALRMPFISANDGTPLFYKDWGTGKPVIFLSSGAMNCDMWQYQMTPMINQGLRCVAYDRRGHGRSGQPAHGYYYDTLADDLGAVIEQLAVPTLIIQGDKDVSAPLDLTGRRTLKLIPGAKLTVYEGAPHGLMLTHIDRLNRDLVAFAQS